MLLERGWPDPHRSGSSVFTGDHQGIHVQAPEGERIAGPGDWVACDEAGQFFVIRRDDFAALYEPSHPDMAEGTWLVAPNRPTALTTWTGERS